MFQTSSQVVEDRISQYRRPAEDEPHNAQLERETEMVEKARARYRAAVEKNRRQQNEAITGPGRKLLVEIVQQLIPAIEQHQRDTVHELIDGRQKDDMAGFYLRCLDAERLALIVAYAAMRMRYDPSSSDVNPYKAEPKPMPSQQVCRQIGWHIERQYRVDIWRDWRQQCSHMQQAKDAKEQTPPRLQKAANAYQRAVQYGHATHSADPRHQLADQAQAALNRLNVAVKSDDTQIKPKARSVAALAESQLSQKTRPTPGQRKRVQRVQAAQAALAAKACQSGSGEEPHPSVVDQIPKTDDRVKAGLELLNLLVTNTEAFEEWKTGEHQHKTTVSHGRNQWYRYLALTEQAAERLRHEHDAIEQAIDPCRLPMVCPPRPWERQDTEYVGGYLHERLPLIAGKSYLLHTRALLDPVSEDVMSAVNAIQATPWRINTAVLDVMQKLFETDQQRFLETVAPALTDPQFEGSQHRDQRLALVRRALAQAQEDRARHAIWFPHCLDWRGRVYATPEDLSPQGPKEQRALLRFANGKPLGTNGERWLALRLAECYGDGLSAKSHQDRIDWAEEHTPLFERIAEGPCEQLDHWKTRSDPWGFLAVCLEWTRLRREGVGKFRSHLPITMDGRCNGLQHIAALAKDPKLAALMNLEPSDDDQPRDIYQYMANCVQNDCSASSQYSIGRGVTKPCVMTIPYGASRNGMIEEVEQALREAGSDELAKAEEIVDMIRARCESDLNVAMQLVEWFQGAALALAEDKRPMDWRAPSGMRIRMANYLTKPYKIELSLKRGHRRSVTLHRKKSEKLDVADQISGSVANVIHSLDAAHLVQTVNACAGKGVDHFAVVHDSFATHACDADVLARSLREQFYQIYRQDWLRYFYDEWSKGTALPESLAPGKFDIRRVLDSPHFFD